MEKESLIELINLNLSQREIAEHFKCSQGKIKYWLKIFELNTNFEKYNKNNHKIYIEKYCPKCRLTKSIDDFYKHKGRNSKAGYCKTCNNKYTCERVVAIKIKMIEYKGGQCEDCGLKLKDSNYCVFDFHHKDPNNKDPNFKRIKYQNWKKITEEIDKCSLLCSNCHRIKHMLNGKIV